MTYAARGLLRGGVPVNALRNVSVTVGPGECVGIVGESGSGKSTLAAVAAGLVPWSEGRVRLQGREMPRPPTRRTQADHSALQMVFQDPYGSLDPTWPVGRSVTEGLAIHGRQSRSAQRDRALELLAEVGLGRDYVDRRPHELSGGQRQRVAIARALAVNPAVTVLDEPTSALDPTVQAQILNLLLDLQMRRGVAFLLISHDLEVIAHLCQRVYVVCRGEIVETGTAGEVIRSPREAYTRRLVDASVSMRCEPGAVA